VIEYLTLEDVVEIADRIGVGPVRDRGLLDSAVLRPRSSAFGEDAYPDLATKAGALMHSIARNHSLVDGNKRLSLQATTVFLRINGQVSSLTNSEMVKLVLDVAVGSADVDEIGQRLALRPASDA
jgi:death on curing protein